MNKFILAILLTALLMISGCAQEVSTETADNAGEEKAIENAKVSLQKETVVSGGEPVIEDTRVIVVISNGKFNPSTVTIKEGTTVTWVNHDTEKRSVSSAELFGSGVLTTGAEFSHRFTDKGSFEYISGQDNIQGAVIVE